MKGNLSKEVSAILVNVIKGWCKGEGYCVYNDPRYSERYIIVPREHPHYAVFLPEGVPLDFALLAGKDGVRKFPGELPPVYFREDPAWVSSGIPDYVNKYNITVADDKGSVQADSRIITKVCKDTAERSLGIWRDGAGHEFVVVVGYDGLVLGFVMPIRIQNQKEG